MEIEPQEKLSLGLALDELREVSEQVSAKQAKLDEARAERDRLIVYAVESGIPVSKVSRASGLSRVYIYRLMGGSS